MQRPQIVRLLGSPARLFAEAGGAEPSTLDVVAALSAPAAIVGAAVAFGYAGTLLLAHDVANVMLLSASFGIQAFAAALAGRVLYGRSARATLLPFALTLVPHEVFFVGITAVALLSGGGGSPRFGMALALACTAWNLLLTYSFFRSLGKPGRLRAFGGVLFHFATIFVLVGLYAHVQDLFPYPPGRP